MPSNLSRRCARSLLGCAVAAVAPVVKATFTIDLRAISGSGGIVITNAKSVDITQAAPGDVLTLDCYAVVTGQNANASDEGVLSFAGSPMLRTRACCLLPA